MKFMLTVDRPFIHGAVVNSFAFVFQLGPLCNHPHFLHLRIKLMKTSLATSGGFQLWIAIDNRVLYFNLTPFHIMNAQKTMNTLKNGTPWMQIGNGVRLDLFVFVFQKRFWKKLNFFYFFINFKLILFFY